MSQTRKKKKKNKKAPRQLSLTPEQRRKIEEGVENRKRKENPASRSSLKPSFDLPSLAAGKTTNLPPEELPYVEKPEDFDPDAALWVYEASDFDDLSINDVRQIWERRDALCGSVEAAAEALALLEVDAGVVSSYQGWQRYITHPDILPFVEEEAVASESLDNSDHKESLARGFSTLPRPKPRPSLEGARLSDLTFEELKELWSEREDAFNFIDEATEAFALLRYRSGIDKELQAAPSFNNHPIIQELSDLLPERGLERPYPPQAEPLEAPHSLSTPKQSGFSSIETDRRLKVNREAVVRSGQAAFRKQILESYNFECCVTRCKEVAVLEAAHIVPYMGDHSNTLENGLCLRVDIHRLFDRYLASVNPDTLVFEIAESLRSDPTYNTLNGTHLKLGLVRPHKELLEKHYLSFKKARP